MADSVKECGMRWEALFILWLLFPASVALGEGPQELEPLPAPVLSSPLFPCSSCHTTEPGASLAGDSHPVIRVEGHTEKDYDCFVCHNRHDMDSLILFSGLTAPLGSSSRLCGQCHSTNFRLWSEGLHGKLVGRWDGPRKITPCTACHDPHRPGYDAYVPEPPPVPPEQTLWWRR
ncbi:MAG: hypothetical protein Kow0089_14590 [Desulfobulbaceae bacterium]